MRLVGWSRDDLNEETLGQLRSGRGCLGPFLPGRSDNSWRLEGLDCDTHHGGGEERVQWDGEGSGEISG